jgi:DNA-binding LytR/AlgR family response regulator
MRNTARDVLAVTEPEPAVRDPMPYRRDLLDIRVVVRQAAARNDTRPDSPARATPLAQPAGPSRAEQTSSAPSAESSGNGASSGVILGKSGFKHVATRVREILYVEAARNYVRIYLENGTVLKSRVPIERLANHLGSERFLRIHRGRLVNIERIRAVSPLTGGRLQLTLNQGSRILVARDRRRGVLAEIAAVVQRRH